MGDVVNTSGRRENRGSTYMSQTPGAAFTDEDPIWATGVMGFRLVHDDAGRVIRDGSWRNTGRYVRESLYVMVDPDYCPSTLGFRLAREDE